MRVALAEIDQGRAESGWKLFLLLPRFLLHKPPRGGLVPKKQLQHRFEVFAEGDWASLLAAARQALEGAAVAPGTRETLNALQNPENALQSTETPSRQTSFMFLQRNSSLWTLMCSSETSGVVGVALQVDLQG